MSVYVDELVPCMQNKRWKNSESCHLFADTEKELHEMAKRIGLKKSWFQKKKDFPHYDITKGKRHRAVQCGAKEVDRKALVDFVKKTRKQS